MAKENKNKGIHLSKEEILKRQEELFDLGVLEEFKDYRISNVYFKKFLDKYSEVYGKPGSISESVLMPLFDIFKKKYPNINEKELVDKAHNFYPIIRTMLELGGAFKLIKKVVNMKDNDTKKEIKEKEELK